MIMSAPQTARVLLAALEANEFDLRELAACSDVSEQRVHLILQAHPDCFGKNGERRWRIEEGKVAKLLEIIQELIPEEIRGRQQEYRQVPLALLSARETLSHLDKGPRD